MAKLHAFPGAALPDPEEPVPEIVEMLEEFLVDAKAGKLRAVAIAGLGIGGISRAGYQHSEGRAHELLGRLARLQTILALDIEHDSEPLPDDEAS